MNNAPKPFQTTPRPEASIRAIKTEEMKMKNKYNAAEINRNAFYMFVKDYKHAGLDLETFLADCHEDNVPYSDEFIAYIWNNY